MSKNIRKIKAQVDQDKYNFFVGQFDSETDALNYLEVSLDKIARKHYKQKDNIKTLELNMLIPLIDGMHKYLLRNNITISQLVNNLINKAIKK
jgi:hypothetical protein